MMPDHKEMGRQPTERERETTFAPHQSPARQGDGDPGGKRPGVGRPEEGAETTEENQTEDGDVAGSRGKWNE